MPIKLKHIFGDQVPGLQANGMVLVIVTIDYVHVERCIKVLSTCSWAGVELLEIEPVC
jgi:hypothetical protein